MRARLAQRWPWLAGAAYLLFLLLLVGTLYASQARLRDASESAYIVQAVERADALNAALASRRQIVKELATSPDVEHFLLDRALGMSMRYGLRATLDFIEQRFREAVLESGGFERCISFYDEHGALLASAGDPSPYRAEPHDGEQPDARVDVAAGLLIIIEPVLFKGGRAGHVVSVSDPGAVSRMLEDVEAPMKGGDRGLEFLRYGDTLRRLGGGRSPPISGPLADALSSLAPKVLAVAPQEAQLAFGGKRLALRVPLDVPALDLVTVASEDEVLGRIAPPINAVYVGLGVLAMSAVTVAFARMRQRAARLRAEIAEADRRRAELAGRNSALSAEIARRRAVEADLESKTEDLDRTNSELRIAAAAFDAQEGMVVADSNLGILRINAVLSRICGLENVELEGKTLESLLSSHNPPELFGRIRQSLARASSWQGDVWIGARDGGDVERWLSISPVRDPTGALTHYIGAYYDVSERRRAEARIRDLAYLDQLTGLPNRTLLIDRARQALRANARQHTLGALLFVDLDNFKMLNDTKGHDIGDVLLKETAARLQSCVRKSDTVARFGGDEFVILLADLGAGNTTDAARRAEVVGKKILAQLGEPYDLRGHSHHCTACIGVALYGESELSIDELLKRADLAMYESKAAGRNALRFFDPKMQALTAARAALEAQMAADFARGAFELHLQPQVDCNMRLIGAEALLRWPHSARGYVPPDEFIPLAESNGMIIAIGDWVMETACRKLAQLRQSPETAQLRIAVNVSAVQIHQRDFADRVASILDRTGADPRQLEIELTESLLIDNVESVIDKMRALKSRGVRFALDDFGTGYSSLSYLKLLPLDLLKIDRCFVRDILVDPNDAAIAKMIIALAETLGLELLAEGVETEAQRQALTDIGCVFFQGYLIAPALPEREFDRFRGDFQEPLRHVLDHAPALLERRPRLRVLSS